MNPQKLVANLELSQDFARLMKEKGMELPESYFYYVKDKGNFDGIFRIDDVMYEWREDGEYSDKVPILKDILTNPEWSDWKNDEEIMIIPALTSGEIGELLVKGDSLLIPVVIERRWKAPSPKENKVIDLGRFGVMTEADARLKMLIYLLTNNLVYIMRERLLAKIK